MGCCGYCAVTRSGKTSSEREVAEERESMLIAEIESGLQAERQCMLCTVGLEKEKLEMSKTIRLFVQQAAIRGRPYMQLARQGFDPIAGRLKLTSIQRWILPGGREAGSLWPRYDDKIFKSKQELERLVERRHCSGAVTLRRSSAYLARCQPQTPRERKAPCICFLGETGMDAKH